MAFSPLRLARVGPSILACGAFFKNTVCLSHQDKVYFSPLIGDLDQFDSRIKLEEAIAQLCTQLNVKPELVVCDLHPDFYSSHYAIEFAKTHQISSLSVQHHVAHIAAVCAEHGVSEPVLGLALDGVGLGADNTAWGGELLKVSSCSFVRLGHLARLPMPGGDKAAQEPWRMAAAALFLMGQEEVVSDYFAEIPAARTVLAMLQRELNCPQTSSMGRLFDAAAGLLKLNLVQEFEAQAAILLQQQAESYGVCNALPEGYIISESGVLDFLPLLSWLVGRKDVAYAAAVFHATLVAGLSEWVLINAQQQGMRMVALGGGCFHNALLLNGVRQNLTAAGLKVLIGQYLPPNDMAICLGQLWYAQNYLIEGKLCV